MKVKEIDVWPLERRNSLLLSLGWHFNILFSSLELYLIIHFPGESLPANRILIAFLFISSIESLGGKG